MILLDDSVTINNLVWDSATLVCRDGCMSMYPKIDFEPVDEEDDETL